VLNTPLVIEIKDTLSLIVEQIESSDCFHSEIEEDDLKILTVRAVLTLNELSEKNYGTESKLESNIEWLTKTQPKRHMLKILRTLFLKLTKKKSIYKDLS